MTGWNENQTTMSLAHGLVEADNGSMTKHHPFQETNACFSTDAFREAMGPGYQAALFREQPSLIGGQPTFTRPIPMTCDPGTCVRTAKQAVASARMRSPQRRFRLRMPIGLARGIAQRLLGAMSGI